MPLPVSRVHTIVHLNELLNINEVMLDCSEQRTIHYIIFTCFPVKLFVCVCVRVCVRARVCVLLVECFCFVITL